MKGRLTSIRKQLQPHWQFIAFFLCAAILLLGLNQILWPTPDEYLYSTITRSYVAAANGEIAWHDINTEHVGLIPWFGYVLQQTLQTNDFFITRLIIIAFALGSIVLLYAMSRVLNFRSSERMWLLWMLPLVTGFWLFGVRYMLDVPAAFSIALLVWLLLKRSVAWQLGLALAFVLLVKEYYWFLMLPVIILPLGLDYLFSKQSWLKRILSIVRDLVIVLLPSALAMIILLDFNIFPYPRLLHTGLAAIFGDYYAIANRFVLAVLGQSFVVTDQLVHISTQSMETSQTFTQAGQVFTDQAGTIHTTGQTLEGIVDAQHPFAQTTIIQKLASIYLNNFSETDLNVFVWPLTIIGLGARAKAVFDGLRKQYDAIRADLIFFILFAVFAYFNYHQADFAHGFRITLPITLCLVYFSARAVQTILDKPKPWLLVVFSILSTLSFVGYWFTVRDAVYSAAVNSESFLQTALQYKPMIYIAIFALFAAAFIWLTLHPHWRWQRPALLALVLALAVMKFSPMFVEYGLRSAENDYDYGAALATATLQPLPQLDTPNQMIHMYGNMHPYRLQYYTGDPIITNDLITPGVRKFSKIYPKRYYGGTVTPDLTAFLEANQIDYLFLNYTYSGAAATDQANMAALVQANPERFTLIAQQQHDTLLEWQIYQYHYVQPEL